MRVKVRLLFLGLLAGILIPLNASAATLDVSGGQLMGASGVNVGGTLYDVAFKAGSCFTLFGGCTPSAFAFPSIGDAADVASSALLAQVFLGPFDSDPRLTNGNNAITMDPVVAWTPFALADGGSTVVAS
ncbi:MAG: hypothetical protein ACE5D4_07705, partial [Thermodesulfobacteriota bacterium]